MAATLLLIHDALEVIQYTQVILDFIMLAQYTLHNEEMFYYIKHILYLNNNFLYYKIYIINNISLYIDIIIY